MKICINGNFLREQQAHISVLDHGFMYGDGFYDVMRTYNGIVLELQLHTERIENSARIMDIPLPWGIDALSRWIQQVVRENALGEARVRVTVTRGDNDFDFQHSKNPTLVINSEPLVINPLVYEQGISLWTMPLQRMLPEIKTLGLTGVFLASQVKRERAVDDILFVSEQHLVREATTSNIFMVKDSILYTPKKQILQGLTRERIIALAKAKEYAIIEGEFSVHALCEADEVFLTNRLREVVPVMRVCDQVIGNGRPGAVTKELTSAYREYAIAACKEQELLAIAATQNVVIRIPAVRSRKRAIAKTAEPTVDRPIVLGI